jgi:hypothetical protein
MPIPTRARRPLCAALLTLLLFPALLQAAPEERWYQVELIVFSHNNTEYRTSELWPADYTLPALEQSRELTRAPAEGTPATPQPFSLVAAEQLRLRPAAERIQNASDVGLLLHLGWLQPGLAEEQAVAVHIYEGMLDGVQPAVAAAAPGELPRLDGTLRLILSRYLHLASDLLWREPLAAQPLTPGAESTGQYDTVSTTDDAPTLTDDGEAPMVTVAAMAEEYASEEATPRYQVFRQQQSRLMRSSEVHYIDHPLFGIIVQVTPYPPAAAK